MTRHHVDVETLADFDHVLSHRATLSGVTMQSIDLRERTSELQRVSVLCALFLGCELAPGVSGDLQARGALVFPEVPTVPFDPYRAEPYTAAELFDTAAYADSFDARVYAWSRQHQKTHTVVDSIASALHDHAMTESLTEALAAVPLHHRVGIMGGHGSTRGSANYAQAANLGRAVARAGYAVFTGGGPGAMEAANLGAWLAPHDDYALPRALEILAAAPTFTPDIDAWADAAADVRRRWPLADATVRSVGIPTWFYGHEPPNQFATVIAKYFANPLREATLLERCQGGIVYLPGAAGTVSEVFMDACENYYAAEENIARMVLVGKAQWQQILPAWPLLESLAAGRSMQNHIHLVDTVDEAIALLTGDSPS
ncbi:LOG family protein [Microbacterium sp. YY-03]|uniref:LOG family protein n=1 Tax=Microbacterium sp. YY-03 TaxID=3421636 RepID=UPI003D172DE6